MIGVLLLILGTLALYHLYLRKTQTDPNVPMLPGWLPIIGTVHLLIKARVMRPFDMLSSSLGCIFAN